MGEAHECYKDDTWQTAVEMLGARGNPKESPFIEELYTANARTITNGDTDFFKFTVPANSAYRLDMFEGNINFKGIISDSNGTVMYNETDTGTDVQLTVENQTTSSKTYYVSYEAATSGKTTYYVPYYRYIGQDLDDDGVYAQDSANFRDCDDTNPSIYFGAPEDPTDNIDSDCDGDLTDSN